MSRQKQMEIFAGNSIREIVHAKDQTERDRLVGMYAGFLAGVRLTNAISQQEYNKYYAELQEIAHKLEAA